MGAVTASAAQADLTLDEDSLAGRVALVTGGTRGIGAAISLSLVRRGATVAAGFSANQGAAVAFRERLQRAGSDASIHQGNVGDPEHCARVIDEVIEQHGRLDILVNNAGVTVDRPVSTMRVEDWHKVLRVNLSGAFYMSQPALAHMLERGSGRIINISSVVGGDGQHRTGQLRRIEVRAARTHQDAGPRSRVRAREGGQARQQRDRAHRQRGHPRADRDRDDRCRTREGDRQAPGHDPASTDGTPRGGRPRRAIPRRGRLGLHHRPGLGRQRRL